MDNPDQRSDEAILAELGERLSTARLSRDLTQAQLALDAGVSKRTVERIEAGRSTQLTSFIRILRTLGLLDGLESLLPPPQPSPMDLLRRAGRRPRRATGKKADSGEPWTWGNESQ
jgi:transcriptional regulator with XRE-family HTH domain